MEPRADAQPRRASDSATILSGSVSQVSSTRPAAARSSATRLRIVIFRDTLRRDFGHDPELLRARVTRTVRHELAHHLGWDEHGIRELGL